MIKPFLTATALSFAVGTAAWALPVSQTALPLNPSDLIQVGQKNKHDNHNNHNHNHNHNNHNNHNHNHGGKYYYGNRYWGHRYNVRPYNWQGLGCVLVGPVWYCP